MNNHTLSLILLFLSLTFFIIYSCGCLPYLNEGFESKNTIPTPPIHLLRKFKELSKESFQEIEDLNPCQNIKLTKKEDPENQNYKYCLEFPDKKTKRCYTKEKHESDITPFMLAYTAFGDLWLTTPKNQRKKCLNDKKNELANWWLCDPLELKKIENNLPSNQYSKEIHNNLKEICRLDD
jgi:hypothetical protein